MKSLVFLLLGAALLGAEEQVQFQPGVLAKVYACGALHGKLGSYLYEDTTNLWPIKSLPDSPGEILRLKELPSVEATTIPQLAKDSLPSYLVTCKTPVLRGVNFYAVEFEGYLLAPTEGTYTLVVTCDDPVEVFVEGKTVLASTYAVNPASGPVVEGSLNQHVTEQALTDLRLKAHAETTQASVRLAPNKFYHVIILCRQRWIPVSELRTPYGWVTSGLNRGAVFRVSLTTPDGKSGPLALQLPAIAKAAP